MIDCFFEIIAAAGPFFIFSQMGEGKDTGNLLFKSLTSSNSSVQFVEDETGITFSSSGGNVTVPGIEIDEIAWGTGTGITSSTIIPFFTQQKSRALKVDKRENYESVIGVGIWSPKTNCDNLQQSARCRNHMIIGGSKNITSNSTESCNNVILSGICNTIQGWSLLSGVGPKFGCHDVIVAGRENFIYSSQNSVIVGGCKNSFYDVSNTSRYDCNGGYNSTIIGSQKVELCRSAHNTAILSSSNLTFSATTGLFSYFDTSSVISSLNFCSGDIIISFFQPDMSSIYQKSCLNQLISTTNVNINSVNNSVIASSRVGIFGSVSGTQSAKNNVILSSHGSYTFGSSGNFSLSSLCSVFSNISFVSADKIPVTNNIIMTSNKSVITAEGGNPRCKLQNSAIISGYCNEIQQVETEFRPSVEQSVIIGGCQNRIISSCNSLITNSISATVSRDASSIISTSTKSVITGNNGTGTTGYDKSRNNSILTSVDSVIICSQNSSIISSINSTASGIKNAIINSSRNSTIIGNRCAPAYVFGAFCHQHSNMISSNYNSNIRFAGGSAFFGGNNFMMSGSYNNIFVNGNSNFNSIIAGASNSICRTSDSVILAGSLNSIYTSSSSYGTNVIVGGCCNKILGKPKFSAIIGGQFNLIEGDAGRIGISIVGGCQICNKYAYTTMVPRLSLSPYNSFLSNIWMCGFTGSTGTWSSTGASIRVCNGLVVCIT